MLKTSHILCAMVFWGQIQNYMMRVNLSILIVAMVRDTPLPNNSTEEAGLQQEQNLTCLENRNWTLKSDAKTENNEGFDWDELVRGQVLSAFAIGYVTTQIIGGRMTEVFGVKKIYGFGLLFTAFLCFLSPVAAKFNVWAFFVLRMVQGMFEGVTFPSLHAMTVRWVPLEERNSFIARSMFGTTFGLIITFPLCGILIDSYGWESAFYVIGSITCLWFIFWWFLVYDTPDQHPRIDLKEKLYIQSKLGKTIDAKPKPIPWKAILTSIPVWGMIITDCGNCWGIVTLGSNGPTYLKYMLGVDIKTNGVLSGLPMLCRYIGGLVTGAISDYILSKKWLSVGTVRRIFNSICMFGPAIAMLILAFSPQSGFQCNVGIVITLLCIGMFLNGSLAVGHFAAPSDLAPNYAGTVFGLSNTISGGSFSFIVPIFIGAVTQNNMTFEAWTIVFGAAAASFIVTNIFYLFMISGEIQPWNYQHSQGVNNEEEVFLKTTPSMAKPEDTNDI